MCCPTREQQWRGFARDAGEGQHDARDHTRSRGAQSDRKRRPPARNTESIRCFAQRLRHQQQHLFRRPSDGRNHHDRQRHSAGQR